MKKKLVAALFLTVVNGISAKTADKTSYSLSAKQDDPSAVVVRKELTYYNQHLCSECSIGDSFSIDSETLHMRLTPEEALEIATLNDCMDILHAALLKGARLDDSHLVNAIDALRNNLIASRSTVSCAQLLATFIAGVSGLIYSDTQALGTAKKALLSIGGATLGYIGGTIIGGNLVTVEVPTVLDYMLNRKDIYDSEGLAYRQVCQLIKSPLNLGARVNAQLLEVETRIKARVPRK